MVLPGKAEDIVDVAAESSGECFVTGGGELTDTCEARRYARSERAQGIPPLSETPQRGFYR